MACNILQIGRDLPCLKGLGGIKSILLVDYGLLGALSVTGAELTAIGATPAAYQFLVKAGSSGMEQTITHVFVQDFNSNYFLVGAYNGADVSAGTIGTGTALADFTGFNLTFTAQEQLPAFFCAAGVISALAIASSPIQP